MDKLQHQIDERRREISTDAYSMSIGEITNLYRDEELDVHPEFQRVYRWRDDQKSNLIESILLGIPIPSIFVAQADDGTWDVVDGVQRISTILELQGLLRDENRKEQPRLRLQKTRYLPELEGKFWEHEREELSLTQAQRLDIRRAKFDLKIIKRESTPDAKYDLFQRLNGYGSVLTAQELRSCIIVSVDAGFYEWLLRLTRYPAFVESASLSDRLITEQYDMELVLRYFTLRNLPEDEIRSIGTLREFLTNRAAKLAEGSIDLEAEERHFKATFDTIYSALSDDAFRFYNISKQRFQGSFSNTAFEVLALGLGHHIEHYLDTGEAINCHDRVLEFWQGGGFGTGFATGKSPDQRLSITLPRGRSLFEPK